MCIRDSSDSVHFVNDPEWQYFVDSFPFSYEYSLEKPATLVLSKTHDVTQWLRELKPEIPL